ncbi:MAG: GumC family protein [Rhizobium sp.]|nr:GumC family protein [Rhizobium sp.]
MDIDIFQLPAILKRRLHYVVIAVALCVAMASIYVLQLKPIFSSTAEILLDPLGLSAESVDGKGNGNSAQQDQSNLDSQIYVMQSRGVMSDVARKLDLVEDPFYAPKKSTLAKPVSDADRIVAVAEAMKTHVTIERAGQSLVFTVSAEHPDAGKAADIANAVANVYLQQLDQARGDAARRASNSFQIQAGELRDRVLKAELAVEKFKSENGLVSTGEQGLVIDQQVQGINEQLIAARGVEEQQQTIYEQAKNLTMNAIEAGAIPEVLQSTSIGLLRDRYAELLDKRTQLATNLGANHPQLRAINSQVANMQAAIETELARVRQSMRINYERAAANTKALNDRLQNLSKTSFDSSAAQIKMRQLESEADAVRAIYKTFLSRAEELAQQQSVNMNNSRVITAAVPMPKSSLKLKLMILLAAGLFGTVLGSGLAVLRELLPGPRKPQPSALERAGLPVISRISIGSPGRAAQPSRLRSLLPFGKKPTPAAPATPGNGILQAARALRDATAGQQPATVLFISAGQVPQASGIVADIVHALIDAGLGIVYAPGSIAEAQTRQRSGSSPSLAAALARDDSIAAAPLSDILKYENFPAVVQPSRAGRPTLSRYVDRARQPDADLVVINACQTAAAEHLPLLIQSADAVIVVVEPETVTNADMDAALDVVGDARDLVLGTILVETA